MKKLKYLLFLFIVFLVPNVFAQEFNMNSYTSATKNGTTSRYRATEIYNTGISNTYTFGTQYNGRISDIETYFNYPFVANTTYTLTYNMNTDDFRNNFGSSYWWDCDQSMTNTNATVVSPTYVSMRKVKFTFRTTENTTCIRVWLRSSNLSSTAITGVSNWRLNNITIYDPDFQDGSSGGNQGSSSGNTTTDNTNSDIINNANQNTQDIIENNNQNTQNIINSNDTSNADSTRNNFDTTDKNCGMLYKYTTLKGRGFYSNGSMFNDDNMYYTDDYIPLDNATKLVLEGFTSSNTGNLIIYDSSKNFLDYWGVRNQTISLPSNASYFRIATTNPYGRVFKDKGCTSKLDETNSYLMDDSDPNISDNEFLSLFNSIGFNDPLSYLLQLPVQLINQLVSQSDTCQTVNLGTLYNVPITLPCLNIGSIVGQQVWDIIDVLFSVGLLVVIIKNLYQTFANLMTMGGEKEAREKFSMPTPMEFLSMILGGDR